MIVRDYKTYKELKEALNGSFIGDIRAIQDEGKAKTVMLSKIVADTATDEYQAQWEEMTSDELFAELKRKRITITDTISWVDDYLFDVFCDLNLGTSLEDFLGQLVIKTNDYDN